MRPRHPDRLRDGRAISAVLTGRRSRAGRLVVLHARERGDDRPARMTVIASRRVGNAVARNRAKRITREAAARVAWRDGVDLVAICRAACAGSSTWPVHDDLVPLAERLGVTATSPVATP